MRGVLVDFPPQRVLMAIAEGVGLDQFKLLQRRVPFAFGIDREVVLKLAEAAVGEAQPLTGPSKNLSSTKAFRDAIGSCVAVVEMMPNRQATGLFPGPVFPGPGTDSCESIRWGNGTAAPARTGDP